MNATEAVSIAHKVAKIYDCERDGILGIMNASTNTVSADLKRTVIMQESMRAFAKGLIPIALFSTVFSNVPLQGDDTVTVPYFPLPERCVNRLERGQWLCGIRHR